MVFIDHEETTKEGKHIPKGDKRSIKPIIDNSDVVVFLSSNGIDEDRNVVKSSAWFAETKDFFARSRFDYIDTYLEEFTAENLEAVIAEAIQRQEDAEGVPAVSYEKQKETFTSETFDLDDLVKQINGLGTQLAENGRVEEVVDIIEKHLGKGKKVSDAKKSQVEVLAVILDDLQDLLSE